MMLSFRNSALITLLLVLSHQSCVVSSFDVAVGRRSEKNPEKAKVSKKLRVYAEVIFKKVPSGFESNTNPEEPTAVNIGDSTSPSLVDLTVEVLQSIWKSKVRYMRFLKKKTVSVEETTKFCTGETFTLRMSLENRTSSAKMFLFAAVLFQNPDTFCNDTYVIHNVVAGGMLSNEAKTFMGLKPKAGKEVERNNGVVVTSTSSDGVAQGDVDTNTIIFIACALGVIVFLFVVVVIVIKRRGTLGKDDFNPSNFGPKSPEFSMFNINKEDDYTDDGSTQINAAAVYDKKTHVMPGVDSTEGSTEGSSLASKRSSMIESQIIEKNDERVRLAVSKATVFTPQ